MVLFFKPCRETMKVSTVGNTISKNAYGTKMHNFYTIMFQLYLAVFDINISILL